MESLNLDSCKVGDEGVLHLRGELVFNYFHFSILLHNLLELSALLPFHLSKKKKLTFSILLPKHVEANSLEFNFLVTCDFQ